MTKIPKLRWIATTLILSGGFLSAAGAQPMEDAPPIQKSDSPPRYQEPVLSPHPDINPVSESATSPSTDAAEPGGLPPSTLQVHNDQGVRYISGGVGESERAELNAQSEQFNLRLLFAIQDSGEYLSAIQVKILDANDATILTADSKGPLFMAQLAPGNYAVEVTLPDGTGQQTQRQNAHINDSSQSQLNFYWR